MTGIIVENIDEEQEDLSENAEILASKRVKFKLSRNETNETVDEIVSKKTAQYYIPSNDTLLSMNTTYSLEVGESSDSLSKHQLIQSLIKIDSALSRLLAKFVILHSRSSGVDKTAAFFQYGAMFYGDIYVRLVRANSLSALLFYKVKTLSDISSRWWTLLDDSMSSGRKVLRLFKWLKEIERARLTLTLPRSFLGYVRTNFSAVLTRSLTFVAHIFAACYYFFDNLVWAAQLGLVNSVKNKERGLLRLFKHDFEYEKFKEYQIVYQSYLKSKQASEDKIKTWKDIKNFASLYRLILAVFNNLLTIRNLRKEEHRLKTKYSFESDIRVRSVEDRIDKIHSQVLDKKKELLAVTCNLIMTLSRLKFKYFVELPLYVIGGLGMIAGALGILKNWPKKDSRSIAKKKTKVA